MKRGRDERGREEEKEGKSGKNKGGRDEERIGEERKRGTSKDEKAKDEKRKQEIEEREQENSKKKKLPGSWSPPRAIPPRRYREGGLSPSTTSRWPGIGGGTGESRGAPPYRGAGLTPRSSPATSRTGNDAIHGAPWSHPSPPGGLGLGAEEAAEGTRGAGAPGGKKWGVGFGLGVHWRITRGEERGG